jgi:hypothetical protein
MALLMIPCPNTEKLVAIGWEVRPDGDIAEVPASGEVYPCPECEGRHPWNRDDAKLVDDRGIDGV